MASEESLRPRHVVLFLVGFFVLNPTAFSQPVAAPSKAPSTNDTTVPAPNITTVPPTLNPSSAYPYPSSQLNATCRFNASVVNTTAPTYREYVLPYGNVVCQRSRPPRKWPFSWRYWTTNLYQILDSENNEVLFAGVDWMGAETKKCVPHGLDRRSYKSYLDDMSALRFNLIRYAISGSIFNGTMAGEGINATANPDLVGLSCLQVLDKIVAAAYERRIRIMIDYHKVSADAPADYGLWFNEEYSEDVWVANWVELASRYADNPTVAVFDLFNAPRWSPTSVAPDYIAGEGDGVVPNFRYSCDRAAQAIQKANKDVLISISGMQYQDPVWPGGDISRYRYLRINVTDPSKIIYSAQEFGPMTNASHPWFNQTNFQDYIEKRWDNNFGFMDELVDGAPVWIIWGSKYNRSSDMFELEQDWVFKFRAYMLEKKFPWVWHAWTPDDPATGGILMDDYVTVDKNKTFDILSVMMYPYATSVRDDPLNGPMRPPSPPPRAPFIQFRIPNITLPPAPAFAPVAPSPSFLQVLPPPSKPSNVLRTIARPHLLHCALVSLVAVVLFS